MSDRPLEDLQDGTSYAPEDPADMQAAIDNLQRDLAAANVPVGELERYLGNLLARINRDGGQRQSEMESLAAAVWDAEQSVTVMFCFEQERGAERDELTTSLDTMTRKMQRTSDEATALRGVVERLHSWLIHHKWCKVYTFAPDYRLDDERCTCNLTATLAAAAAVPEPAPDARDRAVQMVIEAAQAVVREDMRTWQTPKMSPPPIHAVGRLRSTLDALAAAPPPAETLVCTCFSVGSGNLCAIHDADAPSAR